MRGRQTNLALAGVLALALVSGAVAFAVGTAPGRLATLVHGVAGFGVLVLSPWKTMVARRGWRRHRGGRAGSALLAVLIMVALAAGVSHSTGVAIAWGPLTAMQVHVGAALLSVPVAVFHLRGRPVRPRRTDVSRRSLLRAGGLALVAAAIYGSLEGVARAAGWPGGKRRHTGSHERGSHSPAEMPVTQWLDDRVPVPTPDPLLTLVTRSGRRTWTASADTGGEEVTAVLDCTGGWFAAQTWTGVRVDHLLDPQGARSVVVRSVTGYSRRFPVDDVPDLWLAWAVEGTSLSPGHGAPYRLVAPERRGFWWVKWVVEIRTSPLPWWVQSPFPLT